MWKNFRLFTCSICMVLIWNLKADILYMQYMHMQYCCIQCVFRHPPHYWSIFLRKACLGRKIQDSTIWYAQIITLSDPFCHINKSHRQSHTCVITVVCLHVFHFSLYSHKAAISYTGYALCAFSICKVKKLCPILAMFIFMKYSRDSIYAVCIVWHVYATLLWTPLSPIFLEKACLDTRIGWLNPQFYHPES